MNRQDLIKQFLSVNSQVGKMELKQKAKCSSCKTEPHDRSCEDCEDLLCDQCDAGTVQDECTLCPKCYDYRREYEGGGI